MGRRGAAGIIHLRRKTEEVRRKKEERGRRKEEGVIIIYKPILVMMGRAAGIIPLEHRKRGNVMV